MGGGEGGLGELRSVGPGAVGEDLLHAFGAEGDLALEGIDDALGDKEELGAGFENLHGGVEGEVGEEAEGHADVRERAGAFGVAEHGGLAAGVDVGEDAEGEVVAADEGGGEVNAAGGAHEGVVDGLDEEFGGLHEVGIGGTDEIRGGGTEGGLGGGGDGFGFGAGAGDVGEEEADTGADVDEIEEVAAAAVGGVLGVKIEARNLGGHVGDCK